MGHNRQINTTKTKNNMKKLLILIFIFSNINSFSKNITYKDSIRVFNYITESVNIKDVDNLNISVKDFKEISKSVKIIKIATTIELPLSLTLLLVFHLYTGIIDYYVAPGFIISGIIYYVILKKHQKKIYNILIK